jgi:hypothetical protein
MGYTRELVYHFIGPLPQVSYCGIRARLGIAMVDEKLTHPLRTYAVCQKCDAIRRQRAKEQRGGK